MKYGLNYLGRKSGRHITKTMSVLTSNTIYLLLLKEMLGKFQILGFLPKIMKETKRSTNVVSF